MSAGSTPKLAVAMNYIDDDLISGAIDYTPQKRDARTDRRRTRWAAAAACLCILIAGTIAVERYVPASGGSMGIESICIRAVKETGSAFTDREVQTFVAGSGESIISRLAEKMDIPAENISIGSSGYYHVTVTENENILNLDYLTLPVVANGEIITSVTLYRDAGEIKYEFQYGGTWGNKITELLKQYPDEQFVMIFIGDFVEAAISSDNTVHFLHKKINGIFEDGVDYYTAFKFKENTVDSSLLK